jgi:ribonuclease VapC
MIIDSSAIVAILLLEPEGSHFAELIDRAPRRCIAAPNLVEIAMVVSTRKGAEAITKIGAFLASADIEIVPFTVEHASAAREAFLRYGKGRHPAGLNFGDCIAYATAKLEAMPLLFKGGDFARTDIEAAA